MTRPGERVPLLAIDTCLGACSAAVAVGGIVRAACYEERRTGHAEAVVPMIQRVLAEAGVAPKDLERIAVTNGPGTFAGIRIGLAAAEGLRLTTGAALVPVSSLWALGQRVIAEHGPLDRPLAIAVDAGRGQVYLEMVDRSGTPSDGPLLVEIGAARTMVAERSAALAGSGARLAAGGTNLPVLSEQIEPKAAGFAVAALRLPMASGPVQPHYLRPADAVAQSAPGLRA